MGCAACLTSTIVMRLALFLCYLSFIMEILAFATPIWFKFEYATDTSYAAGANTDTTQKKGGTGIQGLWNHCYTHNNYMCCGTVSEYMDNSSQSTPGKAKVHSYFISLIQLFSCVVFFGVVQLFSFVCVVGSGMGKVGLVLLKWL